MSCPSKPPKKRARPRRYCRGQKARSHQGRLSSGRGFRPRRVAHASRSRPRRHQYRHAALLLPHQGSADRRRRFLPFFSICGNPCAFRPSPRKARAAHQFQHADARLASRSFSARQIGPPFRSPVSLLRDAIHSMTPYRGFGALATALRDAALLCEKLQASHRDEIPFVRFTTTRPG